MGKFKTEEEKRKEKKDIVKYMGLVTQLGLIMLSCVFVGVLIGIYLDNLLKTTFIFTLIFSLFGMLAAFKNMYDYTMKK